MDLFDAVEARCSVRSYLSDPVPEEKLMRIMEAAFSKVEDENEKRRNRKVTHQQDMARGKTPPRVSPGGRLRK